MALDDWLAGLGGALTGGVEQFNAARAADLKRREIDSNDRIRQMREEIRLMLESMKDDTRREIAAHSQVGQTTRTADTNATRRDIAAGRDQVTMRGQDLNYDAAELRDSTTRRGQDFTFDLGVMRNNTTQRGQDITKLLGIERNAIGREDNAIAREAETGRTTRATDANALRREEMASREKIEAGKRVDPWRAAPAAGAVTFGHPEAEVREGVGTGKPTAQPIEVRETPAPGLPVAPPRSPEAAGDELARLTAQATSLVAQYQATGDRARKEALRAQLARLRAQIVTAQAKETGRESAGMSQQSPEGGSDQLARLGNRVRSLMAQVQRAKTPTERRALKEQLADALEAYQRAGGK